MVLVSSLASVRRGTPSLLAMVETIAAGSISLWLAWTYNSVEHVVIASGLVPFLLLRTRLSTRYTIRVIEIFDKRFNRKNGLLQLVVVVLIPLTKILCSVKVFFRKPLQSIATIPKISTNIFL
jgi:hypothetical protein